MMPTGALKTWGSRGLGLACGALLAVAGLYTAVWLSDGDVTNLEGGGVVPFLWAVIGFIVGLGIAVRLTGSGVTALRWVARYLSLLVIGFLLLFIVGEGPPPLDLKHLCFPFGLILGLALAWRSELAGSSIALLSVASFYAVEYHATGKLPTGPWFIIFVAPTVFFILSRGSNGPR